MFVFIIIVDILFLLNYFALLYATDNSYTNNFRYTSIADAVKGINKLSEMFKKLIEEYEFDNSEETLKKIQWFCGIRIGICLIVLFIIVYLKFKFKINF